MASKSTVALTYLNGDYIVVPIELKEVGNFPEFITYIGTKFSVLKQVENGKYIYREVGEPIKRTEEDLVTGEDNKGSLESQVENMLALIESQQSTIAQLRNKIHEQEEIIRVLRLYVHKTETEKK